MPLDLAPTPVDNNRIVEIARQEIARRAGPRSDAAVYGAPPQRDRPPAPVYGAPPGRDLEPPAIADRRQREMVTVYGAPSATRPVLEEWLEQPPEPEYSSPAAPEVAPPRPGPVRGHPYRSPATVPIEEKPRRRPWLYLLAGVGIGLAIGLLVFLFVPH